MSIVGDWVKKKIGGERDASPPLVDRDMRFPSIPDLQRQWACSRAMWESLIVGKKVVAIEWYMDFDMVEGLTFDDGTTVMLHGDEDGLITFKSAPESTQRASRALQASQSTDYVRPAIMAFACSMEEKLRKREGKGGWAMDTLMSLHNKMEIEADELYFAITGPQLGPGLKVNSSRYQTEVQDEAVDVANFAMMIFDKMDNHPRCWMDQTPFPSAMLVITNEGRPE